MVAAGGGVPVVEVGAELRGVEAVVDKDRTAARLARLVGADPLLVLTDVEQVQTGFGTPCARPLAAVARAGGGAARDGELPEGSMGPKIAAYVDFVRSGGKRAVITALERASDAVF